MIKSGQDTYKSVLCKELEDLISVDFEKLRLDSNVESLKRYHGRVPPWWPLPVDISCSWPLYFYHLCLYKSGQVNSSYDIFYICSLMAKKIGDVQPHNRSDACRHILKKISGWAFPKTFTNGPVYMLFVHLHALTGKAPYTEQQIVDDITSWVSDSIHGDKKHVDEEQVKATLDRVFSSWYHGEPEGHLSFEEYCSDFMRWGTSGGGPKTELLGSTYRTKWAWGYAHCVNGDSVVDDGSSVYKAAQSIASTSKVALKEEAQKTREIITTSMSSYLRQSYLMYRWGRPRIPSPIGTGNWLAVFQMKSPRWYGSIDGEAFDRTVPASFIRNIIDRLGRLDPETERIAAEELKSMEDLVIEWNGKRWDWEGGLLSGWRLTSIIGSLLTCCVAEYIIHSLNLVGMVEYGVMGDDLIFYSMVGGPSSEELVQAYVGFGLQANLSKTAVGPVGEFLRKVLSMGGAWGYPALGMRTLMYANPWISSYTYEAETELSSGWMTLLSRLLPHSTQPLQVKEFILRQCQNHLKGTFGKLDWHSWLRTPVSAGGGGTSETSDPRVWKSLEKNISVEVLSKDMVIPAILGIVKRKEVSLVRPVMIPIIKVDAEQLEASCRGKVNPAMDSVWKHSTNISRTVFDYLNRRISMSELNSRLTTPLPSALRVAGPRRIVDFLMNGVKTYSGLSSISHTPELLSKYSHLGQFIARMISTSKRFSTTRNIQAAVTLYMTTVYGNIQTPFGTK